MFTTVAITRTNGNLKYMNGEHGLDKIAWAVFGASVIYGSVQLLSTATIGLNKFEFLRQRGNETPSPYVLARNYGLLVSTAVISLIAGSFVADRILN